MQLESLYREIELDIEAVNQKLAKMKTLVEREVHVKTGRGGESITLISRNFDYVLSQRALEYFARLKLTMQEFMQVPCADYSLSEYEQKLQRFLENMRSINVFKFNGMFFDTVEDVSIYEIHLQGGIILLQNFLVAIRINGCIPPIYGNFYTNLGIYLEIITHRLDRIRIISLANLTRNSDLEVPE